MTLHRQLVVILTIILVSLSVLMVAISFKATQRHLVAQQHVELNNTAHLIGFALKPVIASPSLSKIDTLVKSLFDSSHYRSVTIDFKDERPSITHSYKDADTPVPAWFIRLFPLEPIKRSVSLSSGWTVDAKLEIQASTVFTYIRLWNTTIAFLLLGLLFNAIAIAAFHLLLKKHLRPLMSLRDHIVSFPINCSYQPLEEPKSKEVATLVNAFNTMSHQIDNFISTLETESSQLYQTAYLDKETGISNRAYLLEMIQLTINEHRNGSLAIFHFPELTTLRDLKNFNELNDKGRQIAGLLTQLELGHATVAKLSDTEFALIETNEEQQKFNDSVEAAHHQLIIKFGSKVTSKQLKIGDYSSVKALLTQIDKTS